MKNLKVILALVLLGLSVTASSSAEARGRAHFGVFIGPGFWYPPPYYYAPYYYPPYYYPPMAVAPAAATTYIEQNAAPATPKLSQGYWYYCDESKAYYPYVKECPAGWQQVPPQPAN